MSSLPANGEMTRGPKSKPTRPSSEMSDTGIPWIGFAPKCWPMKRLRWTVESARNGIWGAEPDGENDIPCVRVADFDRVAFRVSEDVPTIRGVTPSERRGRVLNNGDLLLEKSGGGELQPVGAVAIYDSVRPAVCSNFLSRLIPAVDCHSRFLSYIHAHLYSARVNIRSIKQTTGIQNLDAYSYFCEQVPVPPLDEQRAIAAFLDRETAKIDELIAMKERLIELVHKKRSALIGNAVTKGLNPAVSLKDSGVEWIGQIPEHWTLRRVKYMTKILRGKFTHRPRHDPAMYGGPFPFIQTGEISQASRFVGEHHQTLSEAGFKQSKQFPKGTLVMTITGAGTANVAILNFEACFPDSIVGFVPSQNVSLDYLYNLFIAMRQPLLQTSVTNTQPNLNIDRIGALLTVHPPIEEQNAIVLKIDELSASYEALIAKVVLAVERLREHRAALITSAVSGQIDVRNYRSEVPCQ